MIKIILFAILIIMGLVLLAFSIGVELSVVVS